MHRGDLGMLKNVYCIVLYIVFRRNRIVSLTQRSFLGKAHLWERHIPMVIEQ